MPTFVGVQRALGTSRVGADGARLEIDAGEQFRQYPGGDEMDAGNQRADADDEQRPAADVLAEAEFDPGQPGHDQAGKRRQSEADTAEEMARPGAEAHEEVDGDQIENDPESARNAVLRNAGGARVVRRRLLGDAARRGDGGQPGRDEAVHFAVQPDALDDAAAEGFQAAAVVAQMDAGHPGNQLVGDLRRNLAQEQAVLAVLAPAGDQVEVFVQQPGDHARNVDRVILQVAVHGHDHVAARRIDAGLHCRRLLEVAGQFDNAYVRAVLLGRLRGAFDRRIAAAVIDQHQFPWILVAGQGFMHALDQRCDVLFLVVERDDDGKTVRGHGEGGAHG